MLLLNETYYESASKAAVKNEIAEEFDDLFDVFDIRTWTSDIILSTTKYKQETGSMFQLV